MLIGVSNELLCIHEESKLRRNRASSGGHECLNDG